MKIYDVTNCTAHIIYPSTSLATWTKNNVSFAVINASLYNMTTREPVGTIIKNGQLVHEEGEYLGCGIIKETNKLTFGLPHEKNWKDFLTGYIGPVQNGQYVKPPFTDQYVFNSKANRIGLGVKANKTYIVTDDAVTLEQFARNAISNGFQTLINFDGGGSRHLYYGGKTIYSSNRIPYNAIAFYKNPPDSKQKFIDVSEFQGNIDFEKIKTDKTAGVMIRAGYGQGTIDKKFVRNITECNRLGIPCGAYWFSYAYNVTLAKKEAEYLLNAVKPYKVELPLVFDYEQASVNNGVKKGVTITAALVQQITEAFCSTIEAAKYYCMVYTNPDFINKYLSPILKKYDLWLAQWNNPDSVITPPKNCGIWQYGCGMVNGITDAVDIDECYRDYPNLIRTYNLNGLTATAEPQVDPTPAPAQPWYTEAVNWGVANNIMDGTRPLEPATRAEVIQMIYNYSKLK